MRSPSSSENADTASGIAPIARLIAAGANVMVGTDGPSSNNDLDLLAEMRTASLLAKGTSGDPRAVPAAQALKLATLNGAKALGLDADIKRALFPRTIAGRHIVFYRKADGAVAALEDACWHRLVPLSRGRLDGDELEPAVPRPHVPATPGRDPTAAGLVDDRIGALVGAPDPVRQPVEEFIARTDGVPQILAMRQQVGQFQIDAAGGDVTEMQRRIEAQRFLDHGRGHRRIGKA
eukprot:gene6951-9373_t